MYCGNGCPKCFDRPRFATFHAVICKRIGVLSSVPKLMQEAQVPTTQVQNRYNWYFQTVATFSIVAKLRHFELGIVIATSILHLVRDPMSTAVQKLFIAIIVCEYTPLLHCMVVFFFFCRAPRGLCSDGETRVTPSFFFFLGEAV